MQYKTKKSISLLGYFFGYGMLWLMTFTFCSAFLKPSKQIMVTINSYGEAYIEIPFIIFAIVISTLGLYFAIKEYKKKVKE